MTEDLGGEAALPSGSGGEHRIWFASALVLLVAAALTALLWRAGTPVTVVVDGQAETVWSLRHDVASLLADLGLTLRPEDRVVPALSTTLEPSLQISIKRARPSMVAVDGTLLQVYTHAETVGELVEEAGVRLQPQDELRLGGEPAAESQELPPAATPQGPLTFARPRAWTGVEPQPARVSVRRAVPLTIDDGDAPYTVLTTAATVGEALLDEQLTLYLGDRVQPSLGASISSGMRVLIERSTPLIINADGRTTRTRTRATTVGDALAELGIVVAGSDRVSPPLPEEVRDHMTIQVRRVLETVQVERESIPFQAVLVADDELEIDQQLLKHAGQAGEFRRRYKVTFEDGVQVERKLTDAWVAVEPITRTMAYGRKIVSRPLQTAEGTVTYWRKVRMYATSYSASTAGVPASAPWYGITRLGLKMRSGIVAVDPAWIGLGSRVYVQGYGVGLAADTGSGIKNRRIDLGYDDDNLQMWSRWVEVYLLDPPPPRAQIRWLLPSAQ